MGMGGIMRLRMVAVVTALLLMVLTAGLSLAGDRTERAFPGRNGRIAFSTYDGADYEIYTIKANGTERTQVTNNSVGNFSAAWSPDGEKIAFYAYDGADYEIYTINANGTERTQVTNNSLDEIDPTWSPNGEEIAFSGYDGADYEIYKIDANGTGKTEVTNNSTDDFYPDWGPRPPG